MSEHSPAPWYSETKNWTNDLAGWTIHGKYGEHIADVHSCPPRINTQLGMHSLANLAVITAAPEMLAALKLIVACGMVPSLTSLPKTETAVGQAAHAVYAAIAAAEGGAA